MQPVQRVVAARAGCPLSVSLSMCRSRSCWTPRPRTPRRENIDCEPYFAQQIFGCATIGLKRSPRHRPRGVELVAMLARPEGEPLHAGVPGWIFDRRAIRGKSPECLLWC